MATAKTGTKTTKYEYNADGLRTRKTNADGTYSDYYWMGSMLLSEIQYNANGTRIRTLKFCYDEKGSPIGFVHIDASSAISYYYYAKNLQGDVVALYQWNWSNEGKHSVTLVATYNYDPWGKLLSVKNASGSTISSTLTTNIANVNPFRYRGYYYDAETGFYYLQSRYYDPIISRFINADGYASTGQGFLGTNMFAYCNNNPVNAADPSGRRAIWEKRYGSTTVYTDTAVRANFYLSSLPLKGEPNSSQTLYNPDGTPKQKRWYNGEGGPKRDRDYNHPGDMQFPHDHTWTNGKRNKEHEDPSPDYEFSWNPIVGIGLALGCAIGIAIVEIDNITGIGVADDGLLGPLIAGLSEGIGMIFK